MSLTLGQSLTERYRVDALLGEGGMGAVYRAWDLNLNHAVVVKENRLHTAEAQRQFEREAGLLATLKHPHLPSVSDHFVLPGQGQYLVMDYIEGEDLNQRLARAGPVSAGQAVEWMVQVLDALEYLHSREPAVIHRDVKPANVKITPEGKVWLVDFGLAKVYDPGQETTIGAHGVTAGYAPLEQYARGRTDARTDVYSVGATLYALLTGRAPPDATKLATGDERLVPPRALNSGVPAGVEAAVILGLQSRPIDRFQTAAEFRQVLLEYHPTRPIPAEEALPARTKPIPTRRRRSASFSTLVEARMAIVLPSLMAAGEPFCRQDEWGRPCATPSP